VGAFGTDRILPGPKQVAHLVEVLLGGRVGGHRMDWPDALPGSGGGIYWYGRSEEGSS
jgi:hypothetical protein